MDSRRRFLRHAALLTAAAIPLRVVGSSRDRTRRLHIGAQTNTWPFPFRGYDQLLEIVETLHGIGYAGFETSVSNLDAVADRAAQCRKDFESRGMRFVAAHNAGCLHDPGTAFAELEKLGRVAHCTAEMGALHLIVSPSALPRVDGHADPAALRVKVDSLNRLGEICRREGLKLCYHNESAEFLDDGFEMNTLFRDTDPKLVWFNYDMGNHFGDGPPAGEFSARHFRRIAIYHMKDVASISNGRKVLSDFGAGKIDLPAVVAPLLNSNWEGWLIAERELPRGSAADPAEVQKQCRAYLKQITGV